MKKAKPELSVMDTAGSEIIITTDAVNNTNSVSSNNEYIIAGIRIGMQQGLYSLTDVWRASGGESRHRPNYWLSLDGTKRLFNEVAKFHGASGSSNNSTLESHYLTINGGPDRGTYVSELPLLLYASWINEVFAILVHDTYRNNTHSINSDLNISLDTNVTDEDRLSYYSDFSQKGSALAIHEYSALLNSWSVLDSGTNRMFSVLRKMGYLKSGRSGHEKNLPYQKYLDSGLFSVNLTRLNNGQVYTAPLITEYGVNVITTAVIEKYKEIYGNS